MSYALFIGFKTKVFTTPPTIKVTIDNYYVDEFCPEKYQAEYNEHDPDASGYIYSKEYQAAVKKTVKLDPVPFYKKQDQKPQSYFIPEIEWKMFELGSHVIDRGEKHRIVLEVFNGDNNYTNGFMTDSTMIKFDVVYLVPTSVLKDPIKFCDDYNEIRKKFRQHNTTSTEVKNSYKFLSSKPKLFDIWTNNFRPTYIDNEVRATAPWYHEDNILKEIQSTEWIGSEGYFKLDFTDEMFNFNPASKDFPKFDEQLLMGLSDKYQQYED